MGDHENPKRHAVVAVRQETVCLQSPGLTAERPLVESALLPPVQNRWRPPDLGHSELFRDKPA